MALNPDAEQAAATRAKTVQDAVGHPGVRWAALQDRVQNEAISQFSDVADEWLDLMWCLDQYRIAQAPPLGMGLDAPQKGRPPREKSFQTRIDGVYRGKGNWFATLLALLLDNRSGEQLRSRGAIRGFSQEHQIDLAWPDRELDPVICAESKVSGAPGFGDKPARGAFPDFSNRRKELKFAATDLKLARREQTEEIGHWDVWRKDALPKCFVIWAARLGPGETIDKMIREAEAVVATYLDGAGIVAWTNKAYGEGYELVPLPRIRAAVPVVELDNALWRIESEIKKAKRQGLDRIQSHPSAPINPGLLAPDD